MKKIILAPDSFKGSLTAIEVCEILDQVIHKQFPKCEIVQMPLSDGGEGFVDCLLAAVGGERILVRVNGPMGKAIEAAYGVLPDGCAVIEMAAASGLTLVNRDERNPLQATTLGTGQLIRHALDQGCRELVIGLGGSATTDGGAGAASALGIRYLTQEGREILSGSNLAQLDHIDISRMDGRLAESTIIFACDVTNPLYGPNGAACVFGPQKGANPEQVQSLDKGLEKLRSVVLQQTGIDVQSLHGSGAAGGLTVPFVAFCGAQIGSGLDFMLDVAGFDSALIGADLVVTGEGRTDGQSAMGKVLSGVGARAKRREVPVLAISGSLDKGYEQLYAGGITSMFAALQAPQALEDAMAHARENLTRAAENIFRLMRSIDR